MIGCEREVYHEIAKFGTLSARALKILGFSKIVKRDLQEFFIDFFSIFLKIKEG